MALMMLYISLLFFVFDPCLRSWLWWLHVTWNFLQKFYFTRSHVLCLTCVRCSLKCCQVFAQIFLQCFYFTCHQWASFAGSLMHWCITITVVANLTSYGQIAVHRRSEQNELSWNLSSSAIQKIKQQLNWAEPNCITTHLRMITYVSVDITVHSTLHTESQRTSHLVLSTSLLNISRFFILGSYKIWRCLKFNTHCVSCFSWLLFPLL